MAASLLLIIVAIFVRWFIIKQLRKLPRGEDNQPRRWINSANNAINLTIVIGLVVIWISELRFLALSIATFVVALVIATREFIQCFIGAFYHASTRTFTIGDWIRVGDHYGEVVNSSWLSTTLWEVDMNSKTYDYTGKSLVIPNNLLVAHTVENLNYMRRYVRHSFNLVREAEHIDFFKIREFMLGQIKKHSASFEDVAARYRSIIETRVGVELIPPEPTVRISTTELGKNMMTITLFCPTKEAVELEQQLTSDFMLYWYEELNKLPSIVTE